MATWILLFLLHPGLPFKTLKFEPSSDGGIAYETIEKSTPLPRLFTLCSAYKERFILGGNSFFTIYGEYGEPWMTLSNWPYDIIELWLRINTVWVKISGMPAHLMNSWVHICIMADTTTGNLSVLVNQGQPSFFIVPELTLHPPKNLEGKLFIGKVDGDKGAVQYQGDVANFNIFSGFKHIDNLLERSCEHTGDIVNKDTDYERIGNAKETSEESWKICNNDEIYRVAIPAKMNWDSAEYLCHKLGGGNITDPQRESDITHVVSLLQKMNSSCKHVWTPISEEEVEGEFKSSVTGQLATFQPWKENEPVLGDTNKHVAIDVESKLWDDQHKSEKYCSACDLYRTLVFTLIGVCKQTHLGKKYCRSWLAGVMRLLRDS